MVFVWLVSWYVDDWKGLKVEELLPSGIHNVGLPDLVIVCTCVKLEVKILRTGTAAAPDTQINEVQAISAVANLNNCRVIDHTSAI